MFCMSNFTTYIMCAEITDKDDEGKEVDMCNIVGVTIVEKTVEMTKGQDRSLIQCVCVLPQICQQNVGTVILKMITSQDEYYNRKIKSWL